ncbi:capsule assembly Wzi family protein [Draconibacterium orientale]|uniref:capsule assembly Wzi family protein n=1 Tax=Draconibacterium orientale TaxID=1168034 RepID=UPI002ABDAF6C|nr:capsule assembly Wzi family protein [Draconibacterium orientale]
MRLSTIIKYVVLCWLLISLFSLNAQNHLDYFVKNSTIIANNSQLPLWLYANKHGKVNQKNNFLNVSEISISNTNWNKNDNKIQWNWGGNFLYAISNKNYFQLNQAYLGIEFKGWQLKGGLFYDQEYYDGLSSTNGNLLRSGNARPYPNLRFYTPEYKPLTFIAKWLYFKFEYDEGLLNDNRYVENTHLHHKSIYFLVNSKPDWTIELGLEHYLMWGGTSKNPNIGSFPSGFGQYFRYVLKLNASSDFPEYDQQNAAGNHVGTYQFKFTKYHKLLDYSIYLSHPIETQKGLEWKNWPDNLLGIHVNFNNKSQLISNIVYEFTNTKHQNLTNSLLNDNDNQVWKREFYEDYFNNTAYKSGYTYKQMILGSPLFFNLRESSDDYGNTWYDMESNRFTAHHVGMSGLLLDKIKWKGQCTYIEHLGTFHDAFEFKHKQISALLDLQYTNQHFPVIPGLVFAFDYGNTIETNFGVQVSLSKEW